MDISTETRDILAKAIEQSSETVFLSDLAGNIVYVNPAFEALTGYSREEALGKPASILRSGEQSPEFYREMWATIMSGRTWHGRLINRRKDGTLYTDDQRISPVKDASGKIKYFMAHRHDMTRELELADQLTQSQKMESMGLLAGEISHDFNNLLTIIIGSMELISEDLKPGSLGHKMAAEILRSSKESTKLIKQLLIFARRQEFKPAAASLNEPVKELRVLLDSLLGKSVTVAYDLAEDLCLVKIEPSHFKQAIMNLAVNARDAMNGPGGIMIRTFNAGPDGLPPSLTDGRYSALEIADTGPGIPKEVMPRIFEPFFTTKPKGKGTGLGLSTVYGIVRQNNGHIFAGNRPGGGAVFTIYFPSIQS